jgi:hypothetical protein
MKRALATLLIGLTMLVGTAVPARADRVYCRIPTAHIVRCYNTTPYAVHVRLTVRTTAGTRYADFWMRYSRWSKYYVPRVLHVSWQWRF